MNLWLTAGLEAAYIKLNQNVNYVDNSPGGISVSVINRARTWGIGPELGIEADYDICQFENCMTGLLSFNIYCSGSALAINNKSRVINAILGVDQLDVSDQSLWRLTPALHIRFGLCYEAESSWMDTWCSGSSLALEIGYEFNLYSKVISREIFEDNATFSSFNRFYDYNYQGLYVSAEVKF